MWDGTRVVSREWVRDATHASQDIVRAYGLLWWLNQPGTAKLSQVDQASIEGIDLGGERFRPGAPADMYWAIGAYGQILQVHPATDSVVVRLGASSEFFPTSALDITARIVTQTLDADA